MIQIYIASQGNYFTVLTLPKKLLHKKCLIMPKSTLLLDLKVLFLGENNFIQANNLSKKETFMHGRWFKNKRIKSYQYKFAPKGTLSDIVKKGLFMW